MYTAASGRGERERGGVLLAGGALDFDDFYLVLDLVYSFMADD